MNYDVDFNLYLILDPLLPNNSASPEVLENNMFAKGWVAFYRRIQAQWIKEARNIAAIFQQICI